MRNRITALHAGGGVWKFTCEAHDPVHVMQCVSSPRSCMLTMREHVNTGHPGQRFTLRRQSDFSGSKSEGYTGTSPIIEAATPHEGDSA